MTGTKAEEKPGSTTVVETKPEAAAASSDNAEALAAFGLKPAAAAGDPDKTNEAKPTPGDPGKETTSKTGSEADGKGDGKPREPKKFFGKYESEEAAELGYKNLVQHKTTLETENQDLRKKLAEFEKRPKETKPTAPKETTSKERYLANPKFKAAYEADVEALGEAAAVARLERDIELFNLTESKVSEPDPLLQEFHQDRLERQLVAKFSELAPDGKARPTFEKLMGSFKEEPSEDMILETLAKAALFEHVPELVESSYKRGYAKAVQEIKEKGIAGSLTADSAAPRSTEDAKTTDEKKQAALDTFFAPGDPRRKG